MSPMLGLPSQDHPQDHPQGQTQGQHQDPQQDRQQDPQQLHPHHHPEALSPQITATADFEKMMETELLEASPRRRLIKGEYYEFIILTSLHNQNEYPWQAALKQSSNSLPFCGGSIITNKMVLTAAHCKTSITKFRVHVGDHLAKTSDV